MNIYEKLQKARVELQGRSLKKSGENKFAKYTYYELGDFLPTINQIFNEHKLFSQISFDNEMATLKVIDSEKPEDTIIFTSPMAKAQLKGCHEIQNLGAVETYQRRYLYMAALEIVEHDALDATTGQESKPGRSQKAAPAPSPKEVMFTRLRDIGITSKEDVQDFIESRIGRKVESSDDLKLNEMKKIADDAKAMKEEQKND